MPRTSLVLPATLQQRLRIEAKRRSKNVAELIRELLDNALEVRENARIERMYAALEKLEGRGPKDVTDASTTINDVLYGENGAWKGSHEE